MSLKRETEEGSDDEAMDHSSVRLDPNKFDHGPVSRDVTEGRTLFLSKLAIDTTAFSVETMLSKFGELKYVMLVTDKLTEQPKGTAFAQFKVRLTCLNVIVFNYGWSYGCLLSTELNSKYGF